jgi:alkyl hydroperoxide reductase subunit AhpC
MRVLCLSIAVVSNFLIVATAAADKEKVEVGDEAPNFTAKTLNPETSKTKIFSLDGAVGTEATDKKKAVLVSFAQGSCDACLKEFNFLEALSSTFGNQGLLVVSVVTDKDDGELKKTTDALSAAKVDYPVLNDRFNIVAKRFFAAKPPTLFIIDENGRVAKASAGYDESANTEIIGEVRKNLGLPVSDPIPGPLAGFVRQVKVTEVAAAPTAAGPEPVSDLAPLKKGAKGKKEKPAKAAKPPKKAKAAPPAPEPKGPKRVGRKPAP